MSRARAATPAAKRRAGARGKRPAASRATPPKPKRRAPTKAKPRRRAAASHAPAKPRATGRASPKRATAKRPSSKRPRSGRRRAPRAWSRPRPLRAARGAFAATSWRYRLAVGAILAVTAAAGYLLWLRDSSLVAVTDVEVAGVVSGDRERIVAELTRIAREQTTLHADPAAMERAAAAFPTVKSVSVDPNFPHGMRIEVTERPPALLVESAGTRIAAAADGTLLAGVEVSDSDQLPVLEVPRTPAEGMLSGEALQQALVVGAAPEPLRPLVHAVRLDEEHGVEVTLRGGIPVRFGSAVRAGEKWAAAAAVLASPKLDALTYLDVRVPERPTAGGNG
jgi:cell division protein FtsQ